jgi:hypothetical protein
VQHVHAGEAGADDDCTGKLEVIEGFDGKPKLRAPKRDITNMGGTL